MNDVAQLRKDARLGFSFTLSAGTTHYIFGNTVDELIDGLALLKNGEAVNIFYNQFKTTFSEEQYKRLDALILQTDDPDAIIRYARSVEHLSNIDDFELYLSLHQSPHAIVEFSQKFQGTNFDKMQNAVIESKDAQEMCRFSEIHGSDLQLFKQAIFQTDNIGSITNFCVAHQEVEGLLEKEDIQIVQDLAVSQLNPSVILLIAQDLKGVDIAKLQDAIIATKMSCHMYCFARDVKGADIVRLQDAVIATKDSYYIYHFASNIKNANIVKLQDAIIATKDSRYMYYFAEHVKGADIKLLRKASYKQDKHYDFSFKRLLKSSH